MHYMYHGLTGNKKKVRHYKKLDKTNFGVYLKIYPTFNIVVHSATRINMAFFFIFQLFHLYGQIK